MDMKLYFEEKRRQFFNELLKSRGILWEDAHVGDAILPPISESPVAKYTKIYFPYIQRDACNQPYRRFEALSDMYNMINFCCVIRAMLGIYVLPKDNSQPMLSGFIFRTLHKTNK